MILPRGAAGDERRTTDGLVHAPHIYIYIYIYRVHVMAHSRSSCGQLSKVQSGIMGPASGGFDNLKGMFKVSISHESGI